MNGVVSPRKAGVKEKTDRASRPAGFVGHAGSHKSLRLALAALLSMTFRGQLIPRATYSFFRPFQSLQWCIRVRRFKLR